MKEAPAILQMFDLLNGKTDSSNAENNKKKDEFSVMPTAKTRRALDFLISSTPKDLEDVSLRDFLQDLFNWDGKNRVNKPLIRAFKDSVIDFQHYPQLVELAGYLTAMSPFLEADHLAQMMELSHTTNTAFAPTVYTMQFHTNFKNAFQGLSQTRIQKIGLSLWEESHNGRWWNMTSGVNNIQENQRSIKPEKIFRSLKKYEDNTAMENIIWSPENQANFKAYMKNNLDKDIAVLSEKFRRDLMMGLAVTPDIAIFLSAIDWLAPNQRPESPINSLLKNLVNIRNNDKTFVMPKKPNTIKDLFPNLLLTTNNGFDFPFDPNIIHIFNDGAFNHCFGKENVKVNLITSKTQLAKNANYMGNCTLTYQKNMEDGKYALFFADTGDEKYNFSLVLNNRDLKWHFGEINSRYNAGRVPTEIRQRVTQTIAQIPTISEQYKDYIANIKKHHSTTTYVYSL